MNVDELLSIPQAADSIGISRASLYYAIDRGKLDVVEVGGRKMLIRQQVERYQPAGYKGRRPSRSKGHPAGADQEDAGGIHPIRALPPKTALMGEEWDRAFDDWLGSQEPAAVGLSAEMLRRQNLYQDPE